MQAETPHPFETMPLSDLLSIVLRRFKSLLWQHGFKLNDDDLAALAAQIVAGESNEMREELKALLITLVKASEAVLARWELTFAQSLKTRIDQIPAWESTSEFLEIANAKTNAEQRIANFSALLVAMGESQYAHYLHTVIAHDPADVDGIIARRVVDSV
ncbi:MAG: hypothetical protein D6737_12765 [Chloroflexi bacterium]|nr:MAG: hypothetical protein D6737_12765 [Chloroflexota bacterium]